MSEVESLAQISALILAGGFGTRLQAVVSDRAKPMAEVNGRPFLSYLLDQVSGAGIRHAVLCTGHRGEALRQALGKSHGEMRLDYSQEPEPLGTGGAARLATRQTLAETLLVMNGDSYFDVDLRAFWGFQRQMPKLPALALLEVEDTSRYGRVQLDPENRVEAFLEKATSGGSGWINGGIYLIPRRWLEEQPEGNLSIERQIFPSWCPRIRGFKAQGAFLDIGTPETYAKAGAFFAR